MSIAVENLRKVCDRVYVSSDTPILPVSNVKVIPDTLKYMGPLRAIEYSFRKSRESGFLVLPVDMPILPEGLLRRLLRWQGFEVVVVPSTPAGVEPFPGLYPTSAILEYVGNTTRSSMRDFLTWCDKRGILLKESLPLPLMNLNFYSDVLKVGYASSGKLPLSKSSSYIASCEGGTTPNNET